MTFSLEEEMGSRFGTCTCRLPRVMEVPCKHVVAAPKLGTIDRLNENNFMPLWWMILQMHLQYPVDIAIKADMGIDVLMPGGLADNQIHYWPEMAASTKVGRQKGGAETKVHLSGGESILSRGGSSRR